jgi:hypothetical protein
MLQYFESNRPRIQVDQIAGALHYFTHLPADKLVTVLMPQPRHNDIIRNWQNCVVDEYIPILPRLNRDTEPGKSNRYSFQKTAQTKNRTCVTISSFGATYGDMHSTVTLDQGLHQKTYPIVQTIYCTNGIVYVYRKEVKSERMSAV